MCRKATPSSHSTFVALNVRIPRKMDSEKYCFKCKKSFSRPFALRRHNAFFHTSRKCDQCSFVATSRRKYSNTLQTRGSKLTKFSNSQFLPLFFTSKLVVPLLSTQICDFCYFLSPKICEFGGIYCNYINGALLILKEAAF